MPAREVALIVLSAAVACNGLALTAVSTPRLGARLREHRVVHFDTHDWSTLRDAVAAQLRCAPSELSRLHEIDAERDGPAARRKNRRRTTGANANVAALETLALKYRDFVCAVVCDGVAAECEGPCDEVVFQAVPALRVTPPSANAAGQRHRDAGYGHQASQVNFWMPLSAASGANTLWVEGLEPSAAATPLEGDFGVLHRFHGNSLFHFTRPNDTGATRVSLDFRVVPGPLYDNDHAGSRAPNGRQKFFVGGFYARAQRRPGGRWAVCDDSGGLLRGNANAG